MYRAVQTTQERRQAGRRGFIEIDEHRIKVRPKRNEVRLANFWMDIPRNDWRHRSWKRHRKTQYKAA